ncbi:MAG TPA: DUF480 domain-containing protein [Thermoguttaceae bacterium]|nr:DUF480 domain-containing protein [Thermoguttaceae bacterium]
MMENPSNSPSEQSPPRWEPIGAIDRRVAGVLVEKAKTTPDGYPMSLNAIRNACNQKSNRAPAMHLEAEDVEESLDRLRKLGAVGMIEGYGRVSKYRHYLYEWLGVDKVELAVMAELLLRGAQTEGELRGRAARMEPVRDLGELRPVLASLKSKGLVVGINSEGRGHVVTHALYRPQEMEKLKSQYGGAFAEASSVAASPEPPHVPVARPVVPAAGSLPPAPPPPSAPAPLEQESVEALRREINELRSQLSQLHSDLEDLATQQSRFDDELRDLKNALGGS